jgi:hypothetical protein
MDSDFTLSSSVAIVPAIMEEKTFLVRSIVWSMT